MEEYELTRTEEGYQVADIPDAVKFVRIDGPKALRLADLFLHKQDLCFASDCLNAINDNPEDRKVIRRALWRSAIINYMKCFGCSKSRSKLIAQEVYKDEPAAALECFKYFKALRDKHIAHDENAYAQCTPSAAINDGSKSYKIEKIVCLALFLDVMQQDTWSSLQQLISKAQEWTVSEFDALCIELTNELDVEPYESLYARESVKHTVPTFKDVGTRRDRDERRGTSSQ